MGKGETISRSPYYRVPAPEHILTLLDWLSSSCSGSCSRNSWKIKRTGFLVAVSYSRLNREEIDKKKHYSLCSVSYRHSMKEGLAS